MDLAIIAEAKQNINDGNLEEIQTQVCQLIDDPALGREPDWPFIFQKVYLHACLKGRQEIADWLHKAMYPMMDPIQQIALRQIFSYGRHLLSKAKKKQE
jgi:hypothetical protein